MIEITRDVIIDGAEFKTGELFPIVEHRKTEDGIVVYFEHEKKTYPCISADTFSEGMALFEDIPYARIVSEVFIEFIQNYEGYRKGTRFLVVDRVSEGDEWLVNFEIKEGEIESLYFRNDNKAYDKDFCFARLI